MSDIEDRLNEISWGMGDRGAKFVMEVKRAEPGSMDVAFGFILRDGDRLLTLEAGTGDDGRPFMVIVAYDENGVRSSPTTMDAGESMLIVP